MLPRPRSVPLLSLLALILVACGDSGAGTPIGSPSATPAASVRESPTPSASPSQPDSPSPSVDPSPTRPAETPAPGIAVDTVVRTTVEALRLREEPTTEAASLGTLSEGAESYVVEGPVAADGYSWYLVSGLGLPQYSGCSGPIETDPWACPVWFGWVAAASPDGDAWLDEIDVDCPTWPDVVTSNVTYGVQRIAYLACFGGEERSLVGFYPEIPDDAGLGGACADVPEDLAWIGCNLGYEHVNPTATDPFGSGFVFSVHPVADMPERGQWIRVTGRFDHPDAADCTFGDRPLSSVLHCRAQFAVEHAEVVPAP